MSIALSVEKDDLVVTIRFTAAPIVANAKGMCGKDAEAAQLFVHREAIAIAKQELNRAETAAQLTDAQIDAAAIAAAARETAIKLARPTVAPEIAELLK